MTTYRRKYVPTIEAIQLEEGPCARMEMIQWVKSVTTAEEFYYSEETWPQFGITVDPADGALIIVLPGGSSARAVPGDYVCRSARGQLFVRSASAIRDTYEPVEPTPDPVYERLSEMTAATRTAAQEADAAAQRAVDGMVPPFRQLGTVGGVKVVPTQRDGELLWTRYDDPRGYVEVVSGQCRFPGGVMIRSVTRSRLEVVLDLRAAQAIADGLLAWVEDQS